MFVSQLPDTRTTDMYSNEVSAIKLAPLLRALKLLVLGSNVEASMLPSEAVRTQEDSKKGIPRRTGEYGFVRFQAMRLGTVPTKPAMYTISFVPMLIPPMNGAAKNG